MSDSVQSVTRHSNLHKCLAVLLSVLMIFGLMPMTVFAEDTVIATGQCGNTAYWKIVDDGTDKTFVVYGTGNMWFRTSWTGDIFDAYDITKIVVEEGITSIGECAFGSSGSMIGELIEQSPYGGNRRYSSSAVTYKPFSNVTQFTIPNSVKIIGKSAFRECKKLTGSLTIPDSVTSIGDSAFQYCEGLNGTLTIGNHVETIKREAFDGCKNLKGVLVIPNSVTSINSEAFQHCDSLTGIVIPSSISTIEQHTFAYCDKVTEVTIPNSITEIKTAAFMRCSKLQELNIPDSVTSIGSMAFLECSSISGNLIIPDSVISIGDSSFSSCTSLTGLTLGNSVESIGNGTFKKCVGLKGDLIIPDSVISIGKEAFRQCVNLDGELILGSSLQTIGDRAFLLCEKLTGTLEIPASVTSIGTCAFHKAAYMSDAYYSYSSLTYNCDKKLEDCNMYKFFEHYRGDSPDDDYQFIEVVEGERIEPTPTQNGTQVYKIYCRDAYHNGEYNDISNGDLSNLTLRVNEPIEYVPVSSIEYLDTSPLLLAVGDTKLLDISTNPDNATSAVLAFSSADNSIATVDENGNVTAVSAGSVIITVSAENGTVTKDVPILVVDAVPSANTTLVPDEQTVISATLLPENCEAFISCIEPACDTNDVIELNGTNVTAVAIGTETVTVEIGIKYNYGDNTETVFVTKELVFNVVPPHTHTPGEPVHENDVRDDDNGTYTFELNTYCQDDSTLLGTEVVMLDRTPAVEAVVGTDGHNEYFTDDKGTDDTSDDVIYVWNATEEKYEPGAIIPTHVHNPGEPVHENDVRDDDNGTYTFELNTYCQDDNELLNSETVILEIAPAVEATVGHDGHLEYFTDKNGNEDPADDIIYVWDKFEEEYILGTIVPTHVHNPGEPIHEHDVRDDDNGTYTFKLNTYCQDESPEIPLFSELVTLTIVHAVEAQPGADGNIEYFVDDKGTDDTSDDDIYVWDDDTDKYVPFDGDVTTHAHNPGTPAQENANPDTTNPGFDMVTRCEEDGEILNSEHVDLTYVPERAPDDTADGYEAYYIDDNGNVYDYDEDSELFVPSEIHYIHNPGEPVHENDKHNDATGEYSFDLATYCTNDGTELDKETIVLTKHDAKDPSQDSDGNIEYYEDEDGNKYLWDEDEGKYVPTDDTSIIVPRTPVTSLVATADRTDLDMDGIQTATITVEINPSDASDKRVTYVSSNPSVVLVDNNGRVLAVGGGTATVTVSSKSNPEVKNTITFNVVQDTYRLDGPNSGNIGETGTISMYTDTAKPYYVKYFTSNNSLLEIDEDTGAYTVRSAGNATITARVYFGDGTTKDVTKSFRCVDPDAGKYRCKMCDTYEAMKNAPIVGIFYTIVHFFVHLAHSIGYAT